MSVLIKNARIVGADRPFPERSDIFVSGDRIVAIGKLPKKKASDTIDAQGAYVSPGFIDVDTTSDHHLSLFDDPLQRDFLAEGVTTIVGGVGGISLAPLLYGELDEMSDWAEINRQNVDWHSVSELLSVLDRRHLGVNFATLIGHTTIRRAITDKARVLTKNEMKVFLTALSQGLEEGGWGLSARMDLMEVDKTGESELRALLEETKRYEGVVALRLGQGDHFTSTFKKSIRLAEELGSPVLVSHFIPVPGEEKTYTEALDALSKISKDTQYFFDLNPSGTMVTPISAFLPLWVRYEDRDTLRKKINDPWYVKKIMQEIVQVNPRHVFIIRSPRATSLEGLSLAHIMESHGFHTSEEALVRVMQLTQMNAAMVYQHKEASSLIAQALALPHALVGSHAASLSHKQISTYAPHYSFGFQSFLKLIEEGNGASLEEGVKKITSLPAMLFRIPQRGLLKEGYIADITCFKEGSVKFTLVNGEIMYHDGKVAELGKGKVLRPTRATPSLRARGLPSFRSRIWR